MVKASRIKKFFSKKIAKVWLIIGSLLVLPVFAFTAFNLTFFGRIFPGIQIAGIDVTGKEPTGLASYLAGSIKTPDIIVLTANSKNFEVKLAEIGFSYDFAATTQKVYQRDRTGNILADFLSRIKSPARQENFPLTFRLDEEKLDNELSDIANEVSVPTTPPSIKLVNGKVVVNQGKEGQEVDVGSLKNKIKENLAFSQNGPINIPITILNGVLSDSEVENLKERGEKLLGKSLVFNFEYQAFTYKAGGFASSAYKNNDILSLLEPKGGVDDKRVSDETENISSQVNRLSKNPVFNFADGKVTEFQPALDGVSVKKDELKSQFLSGLTALETSDQTTVSLDIPVSRTPSEIQTAEVNNLGIKELLGRGSSHFRGSIPSRIYNIKLAASRINGALVKPGDTFSFVNTLGDVSQLTGYQQAYIIQDGRTILGDGGGVCQVSTTFFRAALNAGLPILERRAHSYRVGYYEQDSPPGLDATVFYPTTDLKVKNDTPGYLLIQSHIDTKNSLLAFEIYGTSDGRTATTTKPKITDQVEPPPDLYQDDPTLPAGTVKQVDYRAWGAKVAFNYSVTRVGEEIYKKTFTSLYQPWQAVYLRGTSPAQ